MRRWLRQLVSAAVATASLHAANAQTTATRPAAAPAPNPHWTATGCYACHPKDTLPARMNLTPLQIEESCVRCHDGERASKEVHPTLRPALGEQLRVPQGWPLLSGQIGCVTCHDLTSEAHAKTERPARNATLVRDFDPGTPRAFCTKCHVPSAERFNPHRMLRPNGELNDEHCRLCHRDVPPDLRKPEDAHEVGDLRYDAVLMCVGCHQQHVEWAPNTHVNLRMPDAMLAGLRQATEGAVRRGTPRLGGPPPTTRPARNPGGRLVLPIGADGRVKCFTCHNPHEKGVFAPDTISSWGALPIDEPKPWLTFRGLGNQLCGECHRNIVGRIVREAGAAPPP